MARLGHSTTSAAIRRQKAASDRDRLIADRLDHPVTGIRTARNTGGNDTGSAEKPAEAAGFIAGFCSYTIDMNVAMSSVEVGVRDLKNNLSRYLERVRGGDEVIVTDRGRPVARLLPLDASSDHLADLVDAGLVRPATTPRRKLPKRFTTAGTVSDLVADQRR